VNEDSEPTFQVPGREARATDGLSWAAPVRPVDTALEAPPWLEEPVVPAPTPVARGRRAAGPLGYAATALAGGLIGGALVAAVLVFRDTNDSPAAAATQTQALTVQQTSAIADTAAKGRPSVIRIESQRRGVNGLETDVGSGVVIDDLGHILTNAHVVLDTDTLKVVLPDGTERTAIVVGTDFPFTDLAVLQIGPGKLTPVELGDSGSLVLGETLVAIGNPLAEFDGAVTVGVVSGLNRKRTLNSVRQDDLIQTDAAINNGNSGGALLNLKGQFVAMPTAVLRLPGTATSASVEGIAFALPANRILPIARRIIAEGSYPRPSLGLEHTDITAEIAQRLPRGVATNEGAVVTQVVRGGPADAAGITAGDVLTRVGEADVNRQNPLLNGLMRYEPGQTVRVVLNRNGRIIETEVRLAKRN
jgi:2-alkenal reductase